MFNRLKKVYDVLSDPQKRAVYDTVGASGIEGEGWALVERKFRSAAEIKEEYEQMKKEKEERRMQQRTNPKGNITVLIDATDIFEHYDEDDEEDEGFYWPAIEVRSMSISQTIEAPITTEDCVILGGNLNVRNGVGSGTVSTTLRHVFSRKFTALKFFVFNYFIILQLLVGLKPSLVPVKDRLFLASTFAH